MNVLHVMNAAGGGASLSTQALAGALRPHGVVSSAVCHDAGSLAERDAVSRAFDGRVRFTRLLWWNKKTRAKAWKRPLLAVDEIVGTAAGLRSGHIVAEAARECGADLIHTNTLVNPEGAAAAARLGLPHVWHVRELVGEGQPYRFLVEGAGFGALLTALSSVIVCNSTTTAEHLRPWLSPDAPLVVVDNGIDLSAFTPASTRGARRPVVVGMVGSVTTRWKKHELFVRAAAQAKAALGADAAAVRFVIYGRLPAEDDAHLVALRRTIAECGVEVELRGFLDDPAAVMRELDVMLHPASAESFGRIAVEAMAAGLPVVGVRAGGIGEIVVHGETGLLGAVDDVEALGAHVAALVRDPSLRVRMGDAGRARAEERYSLAASARAMAAVYERARVAPAVGRRSLDAARTLLRTWQARAGVTA